MSESERAARRAIAAINEVLVSGQSRLWPEDERHLKAALASLDRVANG